MGILTVTLRYNDPVKSKADVTIEGDEVYTRVGENLPPSESKGWTNNIIERNSPIGLRQG